jgi:DNA-binding response OmpR family regulator
MIPTILIIDDDAKLNQLLKDFLKDFGYAVITATRPTRGLKKLQQVSPDLVILDIMLPEMDGFEVCRAIRQTSNILQSVLRRTQQRSDNLTLTFDRLTIDLDKRIALLDGHPVDLTTNEFAALALLARNAGKVLNRDQILQELRGMDCDAFNRSVDIAVSRLRQKLKDNPKSPEFIKTVWGSGYIFIGNYAD